MLKVLYFAIITFTFVNSLYSQQVVSGPMLGYSEMRESIIWLQLDSDAKVKAKYIQQDSTENSYFTDEKIAEKENAYTVKLIADRLLPGKYYDYEIYVNDKKINFDYPLEFYAQELWQWRQDPPDFKFAMGSGNYTFDPLTDESNEDEKWQCNIYEEIYADEPDFFLWLGDNVYYRPEDWNTKTGMIYRNTYVRSRKVLQPLLANTHHYAIWDDHDYGPNDSDGAFLNKETAKDVFKMFFPNPTFGFDDFGGITTSFLWSDVQFFLLDNRWDRTPNNMHSGKREILGEQQVEWLIDNLKRSLATFKVVVIGGQFLNPEARFENHSNYAAERKKIIDLIDLEKIEGVVFITGDRHYSELTMIERWGKLPLVDFTVSPLCSSPARSGAGNNPYKVDGKAIVERNYGIIEVSGKKEEREMKFLLYNEFGELLFEKAINIKDLSY
jgi:alkaline phosphatase D